MNVCKKSLGGATKLAGKTKKTSGMPALTDEAQENKMIDLAVRLAEKQLMDGTASSQVITHYLKLGSTTTRLEKELLRKQIKFTEAKTKNASAADQNAELLNKAISAMQQYRGDSNGR